MAEPEPQANPAVQAPPPAPLPRPPAPDALEAGGAMVLLGHLAVDGRALLDALAGAFTRAMPAATVVQRKGLFNAGRAVGVQVHLDREVYSLSDVKGRIEASIGSSVGGVALARDAVPLEVWVRRFADALDAAAAHSEEVRAALGGLR